MTLSTLVTLAVLAAAVITVVILYVRVIADEKLDDIAQGDLGMMTKEDARH